MTKHSDIKGDTNPAGSSPFKAQTKTCQSVQSERRSICICQSQQLSSWRENDNEKERGICLTLIPHTEVRADPRGGLCHISQVLPFIIPICQFVDHSISFSVSVFICYFFKYQCIEVLRDSKTGTIYCIYWVHVCHGF